MVSTPGFFRTFHVLSWRNLWFNNGSINLGVGDCFHYSVICAYTGLYFIERKVGLDQYFGNFCIFRRRFFGDLWADRWIHSQSVGCCPFVSGSIVSDMLYRYFAQNTDPLFYAQRYSLSKCDRLGILCANFFITDFSTIGTLQVTRESLGALLMLAVFASVIAFVLFADVVRKIGVARTNVFVNLIPVFTALFAWMFMDEEITWLKGIGIGVVVLGLFVSQFGKMKFSLKRIRGTEYWCNDVVMSYSWCRHA